ncbi:MAG: sigma-70 family RNA polymerase sigma factor [Deltaproteobacteria bacterium]|nr:sigma-70 family RNA polymerase sigma factor [Deltaproteobacteria bacterium]
MHQVAATFSETQRPRTDGESNPGDSTIRGRDFWASTALAYDELRRLAQKYLGRERRDHTLQATAVVHEAFLRIAGRRKGQWQGQNHFFNTAAREMRRVLIDHSRYHAAHRRGSDWERKPLSEDLPAAEKFDVDLMALEGVLENLASLDERKARVVDLRYFAGLTIDETAEVLGTSRATIIRDWRLAKVWLQRELLGHPSSSPASP